MSFSAGVYTLPTPALVPGQTVSSSENNTVRNDMAASFNLTWLRNGTAAATANIPMGSYKLTGLGAATTSGDALSYGNAAVVTTLTSTSLTATRVPYAGTGGLLQDASTFTFDGTTLTAGGFSGPHNGTVGATTPNTGAFTTLSASSTVSGTGFSTYLASPPAIGGTAAAAGSFTTLTTSSTVTVNGGTANGVAYLNGSKVLTTGSAFQFNSGNLSCTGAAGSGGGEVDLTLTDSTSGKPITLIRTGGAYSYAGMGAAEGALYTYASNLNLVADGGAIKFNLGTAGAATEQMRLTSTGLGIGTSSPSTRLEVASAGDTRIKVNNTANTVTAEFGAAATEVFLAAYNSKPFVTYVGGTERMRIDSSGNLLVGTTANNVTNGGFIVRPSSGATYNVMGHISGTASGTNYYYFGYDTNQIGSITQNGTTAVAYNTSSDYRLKENIQPMQNALATVQQLNPVTYTWKSDGSDGQGFIAHELQAVVPDCVTGEKDAVDDEGKPVYQGVDTSFLVATLTKAIQELKAELDATKAEVAALKKPAA